MRKRCNAYGMYGMMQDYAGYGMTADRAKALLEECRSGKHAVEADEAARRVAPDVAKWLVASIMEGKSFDKMAVKWELMEAEMMPCSRNSFYKYRKFALAILDDMLAGKEAV